MTYSVSLQGLRTLFPLRYDPFFRRTSSYETHRCFRNDLELGREVVVADKRFRSPTILPRLVSYWKNGRHIGLHT